MDVISTAIGLFQHSSYSGNYGFLVLSRQPLLLVPEWANKRALGPLTTQEGAACLAVRMIAAPAKSAAGYLAVQRIKRGPKTRVFE
jgi:hypothetical protein